VVDGCEECCVKKRMDALGREPDLYLVATRIGIVKRGMDEPHYDEIGILSGAIVSAIRNSGQPVRDSRGP
jgi:uncharacterized metal-binding protein